jgi:hypothetical protein
MVPLFAIIALLLILGAAIVSKNSAGKSPALSGPVPGKQAQSSYPNLNNNKTTEFGLNISAQQGNTGSGESYNTNITPKMDDASLPDPFLQGKYYMDAASSDETMERWGLSPPVRLLELFPDADFSLIWGDFGATGKWKPKGTATLILESDSLTMLDVPSTYTVSTRNNNTVLIATRSYGEFVWVRR